MATQGWKRALLGAMAGVMTLFGATKPGQRPGNGQQTVKTSEGGLISVPPGPTGRPIVKTTWDFPVEENERIDFWIHFLQTKKPEETCQWLEYLGYYGPMIQEKLRERGMPEDLVFLAMAESGFDATAYSSAKASGVWQFIAETGRRYGLEVSRDLDERNDPIKSTDAALDYLQDLHDRFGSWYLAAAAYNTGENRVERILRERAGGQKGDENLYWKIGQFLPKETRDYVPLMLAVGTISKDPARYGFDDIEYRQPMRFEEVRVPAGTRLEDVASAAGVDAEQVRRLNPHLVQGRTPGDREWSVRVPPGTGADFQAHFA